MEYTNEEYCDMLLIYDACDRNSYEARRMYIERFPHPRINLGVGSQTQNQ